MKRKKGKNKSGRFLSFLQLIITIIFLGFTIRLDILPSDLLLPVVIILFGLQILIFLTQSSGIGQKIGKVIAIFMIIILGLGSYYLFKTQMTLTNISGAKTKIDDVSILVLTDDPAQNISDAKDYIFGIQEEIDRENTDKTIESIEDNLGAKVSTQGFTDFDAQVEALYSGEVKVIILNEAYRGTIKETYEDFDTQTRSIHDYKVETIVQMEASDKDVSKDAFNVFISGIDTYGSINTTSRSDVNIIATVNPNTKKVLLTTTPRDYYIPLIPVSGGMEDKLTHAGIHGVDVSVASLEKLYGINIDYYVRVNFTTLIGMVDAMGGIEVDSEFAFRAGGHSFSKGKNTLNGEQALTFSRERNAFSEGDSQRGRNQTEVIKGMIKKATSPAIITNYNGIMNSVAGSFETSMSSKEISSLAKLQINDMSPWDIESTDVTGTGTMKTTYSYKTRSLFVMIPDMSSVAAAKAKMESVMRD